MNTPFFKFLHKTIFIVLTIAATTIAYAQSPITMDGTTGAGTGRTQDFSGIPGAGQTINIIGDGANANGTRNGGNLFFSFSQFGIAAGDTVVFQCPSCGNTGFTANTAHPVTNIIGRVTGATPSNINGTLTSTIGIRSLVGNITNFTYANFWLFNPNGVILGPNAAINIGFPTGSAGCSLADAITCTSGTFHNGDKANRVIFDNNNNVIFGLTTDPNASTLTAQPIGTATTVPTFGPTPVPTSFGFPPPVNTPPPPPPPDVVIEPPPLKISPQGDISMVVVSQPAMVNAVIPPPVPKKSCDKANGILGKGVANYVPDMSSQVPNSVVGAGATSGASLDQTLPSNLEESDGCL